MGRRKITIAPIADDRNRSVTFLKRKNGLFKKAYELGVLCSAEIAVIVFTNTGKLFEFSSGDIDNTLLRYSNFMGAAHERRGPQDYASKDATDASKRSLGGKMLSLAEAAADDDDDDDEADPVMKTEEEDFDDDDLGPPLRSRELNRSLASTSSSGGGGGKISAATRGGRRTSGTPSSAAQPRSRSPENAKNPLNNNVRTGDGDAVPPANFPANSTYPGAPMYNPYSSLPGSTANGSQPWPFPGYPRPPWPGASLPSAQHPAGSWYPGPPPPEFAALQALYLQSQPALLAQMGGYFPQLGLGHQLAASQSGQPPPFQFPQGSQFDALGNVSMSRATLPSIAAYHQYPPSSAAGGTADFAMSPMTSQQSHMNGASPADPSPSSSSHHGHTPKPRLSVNIPGSSSASTPDGHAHANPIVTSPQPMDRKARGQSAEQHLQQEQQQPHQLHDGRRSPEGSMGPRHDLSHLVGPSSARYNGDELLPSPADFLANISAGGYGSLLDSAGGAGGGASTRFEWPTARTDKRDREDEDRDDSVRGVEERDDVESGKRPRLD